MSHTPDGPARSSGAVSLQSTIDPPTLVAGAP